jgi:hypothetical protein
MDAQMLSDAEQEALNAESEDMMETIGLAEVEVDRIEENIQRPSIANASKPSHRQPYRRLFTPA